MEEELNQQQGPIPLTPQPIGLRGRQEDVEPEFSTVPQLRGRQETGEMVPLNQPTETPDPLSALEQPKPDPLSAIATPTTFNITDDEATNRRASMYAFAQLSEAPSFEDDLLSTYEATRATIRDTISQIGDIQYRESAELRAMTDSVNSLTRIANNAYDPKDVESSRRALGLYLTRKATERAMEEAERQWAESVNALRDNGDEVGAEFSIMAHNTPDVLDYFVDIQASRAMLMRAIEEAGVATKDRNWFFWLTDMLMYVVPLSQAMVHEDTFDVGPQAKRLYDSVFSGERFEAETNNWWNLMLNSTSSDERKAIVDRMVSMVNKQVSTIFGPNEVYRMQLLNEYNVTPPVMSQNFWNALDVISIGVDISDLVTAGSKVFKTPFRTGNVLKGFNASAKNIENVEKVAAIIKEQGAEAALKATGQTVDETQATLTPSALDPSAIEIKDGKINPWADVKDASAYAAANMLEGEDLFRKWTGELQLIERLSEPEKQLLLDDLVKRAERFGTMPRSGKRTIIDEQIETFEFPNGSEFHQVSMTIGKVAKKGDSPWYANSKTAAAKMQELGIQDAKLVEIAPNQWGIRIRLPVDETGRSLTGARIFMPLDDKMKSGMFAGFARYIASAKTAQSEHLIGTALLSADKKNKITQALNENIVPAFHALNQEEKDVLGVVLANGERWEQGTTRGKWFNEVELRAFYSQNFGPKADPTKFIKAYRAAREVNNVDFYLRNLQEFINLNSQGYETVGITEIVGGEQWLIRPTNAKVFRLIDTVPKEAIWDVEQMIPRVANETGNTVYDASRLSLTDLQKRVEQGYVIVRTQHPQDMPDGSKIRFFLVKGNKLKVSPLDPRQIPYYDGGHRMYKTPYFVKKAKTGKQPWGEEFLDAPFTPTASLTRAEGKIWADEMNIAQQAWRTAREAGLPIAERIKAVQAKYDTFTSGLGRPDVEEFADWMKTHGDIHPFEVVYDRELPSFYSGTGMITDGAYWGGDLSGINSFMETQGRMYTSHKGPILRNIRDWQMVAETYDPFVTLNTALHQISRLSSLQDFKIKAIQKWISSYAPFLDMRGIEGMHPMRIFLEGKFRTGTKDLQSIKGAAEVQRAIIKRQLGWKSDFDLAVESGMRQLVESIAGDDIGARSKIAHSIYAWWEERNIANAAMGLAFDASMGLFNVAQFPLQVQTMLAATSIDVAKGGQAMSNIPAIWLYFRKGATDKELQKMVDMGWHKAAGFEDNPQEYIDMMKGLKRSGFMTNMLGAMKDEFGSNAAMSVIGKTIDDIRKGGRIFINEAERWNRIVAWQMAWRTVKEKFPNIKVGSPVYIEKTRSLGETYSLSMSEASAAAWQRNTIFKIPMQFMPYMFRWHEMLFNPDFEKVFPKGFTRAFEKGGAKIVTKNAKGQTDINPKLRFVTGQYMLYGTAGIPFAAWVFSEMEKNSGTTPAINTLPGLLDRGLADALIFYATGLDVTFSERAGIGMYPTDVIMEFFGHGRYGETSAYDMMSGASGQIWGQFIDASFEAAKYAALETGGKSDMGLTSTAVKRAARSISTLNNIFKAEAIWNYQQYTNRQGEVVIDELPSMYAFAALLGIPPAEFQKQTAEMGWLRKRTEKIEAWAEQVMIFRQQFGNAVKDGDYNLARQIGQDVNFTMRYLVPEDIRSEVLAKAYQDPRTRTVAESISERYRKEQAQRKTLERNKQ